MSDSTPTQPEPEQTPDPQPKPEPSNPSAPEPSAPTTPAGPPLAPSEPAAPPAPPTAGTPAASTPAASVAPPAATAPPAPPAGHVPPGPAASAAGNEPEKRSGNIGVIAALAIGALVGGVAGAGVAALAMNNGGNGTAAVSPGETNITVNDPGNATAITAVAAQAAESVVTISVTGEGSSGSGSGVFLSDDGYVLTNAHVATLSGATADPDVTVLTSDGHRYPATLVGSDPIADLAVVKVDAENVEFKPATFGDSSELNVGDTVVALGAPLGLPNTVTSGIISALNRSITVASSAVPDSEDSAAPPNDRNSPNSPFDFWEFDDDSQSNRPTPTTTIALPVIQTDAAINPGNSGGALLDSDGNVIGINVAIATAGGSQQASGNIGLGFSIPSNFAQRIAEELIEDGTASHGLLGATVMSVSDDQEASATSDTVGAVIREVTPGGAADEAGLRGGDIVTGFNGMPITSSTDLTAQVRVLPGGADAELVYVRGDDTETVTVTLGEL